MRPYLYCCHAVRSPTHHAPFAPHSDWIPAWLRALLQQAAARLARTWGPYAAWAALAARPVTDPFRAFFLALNPAYRPEERTAAARAGGGGRGGGGGVAGGPSEGAAPGSRGSRERMSGGLAGRQPMSRRPHGEPEL